jgi:hypothetical protein
MGVKHAMTLTTFGQRIVMLYRQKKLTQSFYKFTRHVTLVFMAASGESWKAGLLRPPDFPNTT